MSNLKLNASAPIIPYDPQSTFLHQPVSLTNSHEFRPVVKSPAYVFGEQVLGPLLRGTCRAATYVYSKLPSFSFQGASASGITESAPSICPTPSGSYENSCQKPVVTFLPNENKCELTTRCATIYEGLPHQTTSIRYSPTDLGIALENRNGTLAIQKSRLEIINERLRELSTTAKTEANIIGELTPGDVITVSSDLKPTIIPPENWPKNSDGFTSFQRIAKATGGIVGHATSADRLNPLIEKMSSHILKVAESSKFVDIAFVVDTTMSMRPYIAQVQKNLVQFLQHMQEMNKDETSTFRVALLEYRDKDSEFLNRVNRDFTSNFEQLRQAASGLETAGGDDFPEAILDALLVAKNDLSWNSKAKRIVILIGDAPPHPRTTDGLHDEAAVIALFQTANTEVSVYPIFTEPA